MSGGEAESGPPQIEFDPRKDLENRIKHGISLGRAADMVLLSPPLVDDRFTYGEVRYRGYGKIDDEYYSLAFTIRGGRLRAISLRPMSKRERARHANT
jgi:uncharacterized DUF497 family protein